MILGQRDPLFFCLWPRRLQCGRWVWLETVKYKRFEWMGLSVRAYWDDDNDAPSDYFSVKRWV